VIVIVTWWADAVREREWRDGPSSRETRSRCVVASEPRAVSKSVQLRWAATSAGVRAFVNKRACTLTKREKEGEREREREREGEKRRVRQSDTSVNSQEWMSAATSAAIKWIGSPEVICVIDYRTLNRGCDFRWHLRLFGVIVQDNPLILPREECGEQSQSDFRGRVVEKQETNSILSRQRWEREGAHRKWKGSTGIRPLDSWAAIALLLINFLPFVESSHWRSNWSIWRFRWAF